MKDYEGRKASAITWHHVPDLDLPVLANSHDAEMAAAAKEELEHRRRMAGGSAEINLDL